MAIAKKPNRNQSDTSLPDPMAFIKGAEHARADPESDPQSSSPTRRPRKEPVIIRFDGETLKKIDKAAARRGLSRAALVRLLVIENLPE